MAYCDGKRNSNGKRCDGPGDKLTSDSDPLGLLFDALVRPQPAVQVVITAGTWIEYSLHRLLRDHLKWPELLGDPRKAGLDYVSLVRITTAMGVVPADLQKSLLAFAGIRNAFAHDITMILDDSRAADFTRLMPPDLVKQLERRPTGIAAFQWALLIFCEDLYRLLPDEEDPASAAFAPEDRQSFFDTFVEMMHETAASQPEPPPPSNVITFHPKKSRYHG